MFALTNSPAIPKSIFNTYNKGCSRSKRNLYHVLNLFGWSFLLLITEKNFFTLIARPSGFLELILVCIIYELFEYNIECFIDFIRIVSCYGFVVVYDQWG